jgi:excisionase family DNA binding protein
MTYIPPHILKQTCVDNMNLLTTKEVATRWSVSEKTVYRLRQSGKLKCLKVGTSIRFRPQDVEEFENLDPHIESETKREPFDLLDL